MTATRTVPANPRNPDPLELPPAEPVRRPDPWLHGPSFEVDAFLTGLRPERA